VAVPALEVAVQEEVVADHREARWAEAAVGSVGAWDKVADLEAEELDVVRVDSAGISAVAQGRAVQVLWEPAAAGRAAPVSADRLAAQDKVDRPGRATGHPVPRVWLVIDPRPPAVANSIAFSACHRTKD
jgi:hypothetical protein